MSDVLPITYNGRVVAAVIADRVIIGNVADRADIPHIEVMAAYACDILDGTRAGPYNDADADAHAIQLLAGQNPMEDHSPRR